MNGRIYKEDIVKNFMDNYGVSNLGDLLIEVILVVNDQKDPVSTFFHINQCGFILFDILCIVNNARLYYLF